MRTARARAHWASRLSRETLKALSRVARDEAARREEVRRRICARLAGSSLLWSFTRWAGALTDSRAASAGALRAVLHRDARLLRVAFRGAWAAPIRARAAARVALVVRAWLNASQASLRLSQVHYCVWLLRRSVQAWGVGLLDGRLAQSKKALALVHCRHRSLRASALAWRAVAGMACRHRTLLAAFCRWRFACSPEVTRAVLLRRAFPGAAGRRGARPAPSPAAAPAAPSAGDAGGWGGPGGSLPVLLLSADFRWQARAALPGLVPGAAPLAVDRQLALLSECACAEIQRGGWGEANGLEAAADLLERVSEAAASYVRCAGLAAGGGRGAADGQLAFFTGWKLALRVGKLQRSLADAVDHTETHRAACGLAEPPPPPGGPAAVAATA